MTAHRSPAVSSVSIIRYPPVSLTTGTRLGPYEIESAIGAGGMGEVYKARDTKLDRSVAIKILPESRQENKKSPGLRRLTPNL